MWNTDILHFCNILKMRHGRCIKTRMNWVIIPPGHMQYTITGMLRRNAQDSVNETWCLTIFLGGTILGYNNSGEEELSHWDDMRENKGDQVCRWHVLLEAWTAPLQWQQIFFEKKLLKCRISWLSGYIWTIVQQFGNLIVVDCRDFTFLSQEEKTAEKLVLFLKYLQVRLILKSITLFVWCKI